MKGCSKLPKVQFKDNVWTMSVSNVNPAIYDICYKFTPTVTPDPKTEKPLTFTFSLDYTYHDENKTQKQASLLFEEMFHLTEKTTGTLVDLCLSKLMDKYVTRNALLKATVKVQSQDLQNPFIFDPTSSLLYSEKAPQLNLKTQSTKKLSPAFIIPVGLLIPDLSLTQPDKKQKINIKHKTYQKDEKMTFYSEWITIPQNMIANSSYNHDLNIIKLENSNNLIKSVQLCNPRNSDTPICVPYLETNFADSLAKLKGATQFQIVYSVKAANDITLKDASDEAVTFITSTVSLFDACSTAVNKCKSGDCVQQNSFTYKCTNCAKSATGHLCEEQKCSADQNKICNAQHSDCVQFENGSYHCRCPLGFESDEDQTNQK